MHFIKLSLQNGILIPVNALIFVLSNALKAGRLALLLYSFVEIGRTSQFLLPMYNMASAKLLQGIVPSLE